MLPDFQELQQQPSHHTAPHSLKPRSGKPSSRSESFRLAEIKHGNATLSAPKQHSSTAFEYVPEGDDAFLALWPHRYDFLYAPHPDPGQQPDWKTESSHPLSDRLITQAAYLYGVRPGPQTAYGLLDIDSGSPYHPRRDPIALQRLCEALEPLGLVAHLTLTSSDSQGLHLYFPCAQALPSWQLALAMTTLLEQAGFKLMPGWLEVFPNPKPFSADGSFSLYNGHRLPLQQGSYLLDQELCPIASSQRAFVRYWQQAAARNDICAAVLEQTIRQSRRQTYRVTGKAEKFINDLNAEIEPGWSGPGQTNHLLGRIAMRSYIFGHVLYAAEPLTGQALVEDIVRVARALPGFQDYCGHQLEIEAKAREWARSVEKSHYFPYATGQAPKDRSGPSWNQQQRHQARERIQSAVLDLFRQNNWPEGITARFDLLCAAGLSGSTLYNHRDLWHPRFVSSALAPLVENPPDPPMLQAEGGNDCAGGASIPPSRPSLLGCIGCSPAQGKGFSPLSGDEKGADSAVGCNPRSAGEVQLGESEERAAQALRTAPPCQLVLDIQRALRAAQAAQRAKTEAANQKRPHDGGLRRSRAAHVERLRDWVDSGDPILRAEALSQLSKLEDGR